MQFVIERTHSIRAIFSHTNITERAIPIYRSDTENLWATVRITERKPNSGPSGLGPALFSTRCDKRRPTEQSHCGSVDSHFRLVAFEVRGAIILMFSQLTTKSLDPCWLKPFTLTGPTTHPFSVQGNCSKVPTSP